MVIEMYIVMGVRSTRSLGVIPSRFLSPNTHTGPQGYLSELYIWEMKTCHHCNGCNGTIEMPIDNGNILMGISMTIAIPISNG